MGGIDRRIKALSNGSDSPRPRNPFTFAIGGEPVSLKQCAVLMLSIVALPISSKGQIPPNIAIDPPTTTVVIGGRGVKLTLTTPPPPGTLVNWSVNGIPGGNDTYGYIDAGTYTSPAVLPTPPTVQITATAGGNSPIAMVSITILSAECHQTQAPCIQIGSEKHPTTPISSFLVKEGEQIGLNATTANFAPTSFLWNVSGGGTIVPSPRGDTAVYTAPLQIPATSVTITVSAQPYPAVTASTSVVVNGPQVTVHCSLSDTAHCMLTDFDRLARDTGTIAGWAVNDQTDPGEVTAINASKALFSGTLLSIVLPAPVTSATCKNYDWKFVVQAKESASVIIYNPADIGSGVCEVNRFIIALPVHVIWADAFVYSQILDPARAPSGKPASYTDCLSSPALPTIVPCDRDSAWTSGLYRLQWLYRHLTTPGTDQGTISLSPVIGQGVHQAAYDIQADPSLKVGMGWINLPLILEKSAAPTSNSDALLLGLAYDFRWQTKPNFTDPSERSHFTIRKPQIQIRSGPEIAPTTPHDLNLVESETVKLPFILNFHEQPSVVTFYPVLGLEEGSHFATHLPGETDPIFRGVAGADASMRVPYTFTHNFSGPTPITLNFTYRERWLAYAEPITYVATSEPEELSRQHRGYMRANLTAPLNPNLQFQATFLRGSLPPVYKVLTNTVTLGLTFTNPGGSEH